MQPLTREQMIDLVRRLQNGEGDDEQTAQWLDTLARSIPNPHISDLIFHTDEHLTPEQVIDRASGYRPIEL